ncbi:MAG: ATP-binding cassette domain-containing protein [Nitrososphaerota archaeon]
MNNHEPLVFMKGIHKWFGRVHALQGVDFKVFNSEIVGLVGDNGAGKSTLMKVLVGIFPPDKGSIIINGSEVKLKSPKDAMKYGIEMIHQDVMLAPLMNVARNIFLGREPQKLYGLIPMLDLKKMRIESLKCLKEIGLDGINPDVVIENLSGGQRQGVAIARALYFRAKLLILDEPTNNLSVKESGRVLQFISEAKNQGISSVFITHNLHHVHSIADRIVVMSHGRVVGDFKKDETTIEEVTKLITGEAPPKPELSS